MNKLFPKCAIFFILSLTLILIACEEENRLTLSSLRSPGAMLMVERCILNGQLQETKECSTNPQALERSLYVSNLENGTISHILVEDGTFEVVDVNRAVPGVTSIVTGDRPQSLATDNLGALLLATSSIHNDLSIISLEDRREILYQNMDKPPRRIFFDVERKRFLVFMLDGSLRSLEINYDCGSGQNIYTLGCKLSKDKLELKWQELAQLEGHVKEIIKDPSRDIIYVSFSNQKFISAIALSNLAGTCAGTASYPCEIKKIGAGFSCDDGIDNDGDTLIDSRDAKCFAPWSSEGENEAGILGLSQCNDGVDNNNNDLFDAYDPGCVSSHDASEEPGFQELSLGSCADGIDNDGDGFIDRDDEKCQYATDNEEALEGKPLRKVGFCADGIDNDADTLTDADDLGCFGRLGQGESLETSAPGRGALAIDPQGRWLYVVEPTNSQVIIIDLESGKPLDLWGRYPRHDIVGLPVSMIPLAVLGNIESEILFNKGKDLVLATRASLYVASTTGVVQRFTIHEKVEHFQNDTLVDTLEELAPRPHDKEDLSSFLGLVRCLDLICDAKDLPNIEFRKRASIGFYEDLLKLSLTNPLTGELRLIPIDANIISETWRISYEGALERRIRRDGSIPQDGFFESQRDYCTLGAKVGDHLIITDRDGVKPDASCKDFQNTAEALEWEITEVKANGFALKVIEKEGFVNALPTKHCFSRALSHEIRVSDQWLLSASITNLGKRTKVGDSCIESPLHRSAQTRFKFIENKTQDQFDIQTDFFSIRLPLMAKDAKRDFTYEFSTKSGQNSTYIPTGSATTDLLLYTHNAQQFVICSDASRNSLILYNIEKDNIEQEI